MSIYNFSSSFREKRARDAAKRTRALARTHPLPCPQHMQAAHSYAAVRNNARKRAIFSCCTGIGAEEERASERASELASERCASARLLRERPSEPGSQSTRLPTRLNAAKILQNSKGIPCRRKFLRQQKLRIFPLYRNLHLSSRQIFEKRVLPLPPTNVQVLQK